MKNNFFLFLILVSSFRASGNVHSSEYISETLRC